MQAHTTIKKSIIAFSLAIVMASSTTITSPQVAMAASKVSKVYVAPNSGKKYHKTKSCRGLKKADKIVSMTKKEAKKNYDACKLCW